MAAISENSGVVFTGDKAIYTVANGNVIEYKRLNGVYYHANTPDAVIRAFEVARANQRRIRLFYGDRMSGRDWLEESDVE